MKLFQECQRNFAILGINSHQRMSVNGRILITYLVFCVGLFAIAVYFIFEANTFQEYSNNAYIGTAMAIGVTVFTYIVLKTPELFKVIHNCEEVFEKSELKNVKNV